MNDWLSLLYRNQGSLLFRPERFDWGEQIVVVTGGTWQCNWCSFSHVEQDTGASGVGELLANTLAVRSVTVAVLDVEPMVSENREYCSCFCSL